MARARQRGQRDYLYRRGTVWWVRFQYPDALRASAIALYGDEEWPKERAWSLKTTDEIQARRMAQPAITQHLDLLAFHSAYTSPDEAGTFEEVYEVAPGTSTFQEDGTQIIATETHIITIPRGGVPEMRTNGRRFVVNYTVGAEDIAVRRAATARKAEERVKPREAGNVDQAVLDSYLEAKKLRSDDANLARRTLEAFRDSVGGKPIAVCSRLDVDLFLRTELERGRSVPRLRKAVAFLNAAINRSMKDVINTPYEYNPFLSPEWPEHKAEKLVAFDERDVDVMWANMGKLPDDQTRLFVALHLSTGVRPVGVYNISEGGIIEEMETNGSGVVVAKHATRWMHIAADKDPTDDYGERRIAVPQSVIGMNVMPTTFRGKLFEKKQATLSKDANEWLREIGVGTVEKKFYSGRHRAKLRFDMVGCPTNIARHILGHARPKSDSHQGYGGFNAFLLKRWVDHVGFAR